jgi:hypothetical protein
MFRVRKFQLLKRGKFIFENLQILKMFILATFEKIKFGNLKLRNEKFENVKV